MFSAGVVSPRVGHVCTPRVSVEVFLCPLCSWLTPWPWTVLPSGEGALQQFSGLVLPAGTWRKCPHTPAVAHRWPAHARTICGDKRHTI